MGREGHLVRGAVAGVIGGLVGSWVMNEFMSNAGKRVQQAVQTNEQNQADEERQRISENQPQEDATMKAADLIVKETTGGRHLSWKEKEQGGPIVHYAFGALVGGVYGALAECAPGITAGAGTSFGAMLFTGADLFAVPALGLSQSPTQQPVSKLASPFLAHLVYGVTTDIVRRLLR